MTNTVFTLPGGRRRVITIPATAGNVAYQLQPGGSTLAEIRLHLVSARLTLVCDATVASRLIQVRRLNSAAAGISSTLGAALQGAPATASQTTVMAVSPIGSNMTAGSPDVNALLTITPEFFTVEKTGISGDSSDQVFDVRISNGVAGDSFSGTIEVIEVPC